MSPCTQGHRRLQTKGPASCGASSIRENRAAVLPAPRQNGGDTRLEEGADTRDAQPQLVNPGVTAALIRLGQQKPLGAIAVTTLEIGWVVLLLTTILGLMALLVD